MHNLPAANIQIYPNKMLTFAALKIFLTAAEISGPIPSPGMRVTVLGSTVL